MSAASVLVQSLITVSQIQRDTSGHRTGLFSVSLMQMIMNQIQCLGNAFRFSEHCDRYCAALFLLASDSSGKEYSSTQLIT